MKKVLCSMLLACAVSISACNDKEGIKPMRTTSTDRGITSDGKQISSHLAPKQLYTLNEASSVVEWRGHSPAVSHHGSFAVRSQAIEVVNGKVKAGKITIPIASIQNFNLPDPVKPILLEHLKSPDFFNMILYPEATFEIRQVIPLPGPAHERENGSLYKVTGDFTLLGKTLELSFPANIIFSGNTISVEADFTIDRTKWGMTYAADPALGEHYIYPEVDLHLNLTGNR